MPKTWRLVVAAVLAISGIAPSGALLLEHHGESAAARVVRPVCGAEADSGCEKVKASPYSEVRGLPLAATGLFYFGSLALLLSLALAAAQDARNTAASIGLLLAAAGLVFDLVLLGIQVFAVHALCTLCLLSYVPTVGILALLLPARSGLVALFGAARHEGPRLLVSAWVLASAALALAVLGAEGLLDSRQLARAVAGSAPAETLSLPAARAEVRHLREVLEDPNKLEQYFTERAFQKYQQEPVQTIDISQAPSAGLPGAPIRVVVYTDFLCPWCRQLARWLPLFMHQVRDRLAVSFKSFPLDQDCNPKLSRTLHPGACLLALGGVCAAEQGHFWEYHDLVFRSTIERATRDDTLRFAREAKLNTSAFERCLSAPATVGHVLRDVEEAERVGVDATPTVLVDGRRLQRPDLLPMIVLAESDRLGLPRPTPSPQPAGH
jgi:protein-disulfide isomerase/uncharacterized membrane protein